MSPLSKPHLLMNGLGESPALPCVVLQDFFLAEVSDVVHGIRASTNDHEDVAAVGLRNIKDQSMKFDSLNCSDTVDR